MADTLWTTSYEIPSCLPYSCPSNFDVYILNLGTRQPDFGVLAEAVSYGQGKAMLLATAACLTMPFHVCPLLHSLLRRFSSIINC